MLPFSDCLLAATHPSPVTAVLGLITVAIVILMATRETRRQGEPRFRLRRGRAREREALAVPAHPLRRPNPRHSPLTTV